MNDRLRGVEYLANEPLYGQDGTRLADIDEPCGEVPEQSLGWLLEQGRIRPAVDRPGEDDAT